MSYQWVQRVCANRNEHIDDEEDHDNDNDDDDDDSEVISTIYGHTWNTSTSPCWITFLDRIVMTIIIL